MTTDSDKRRADAKAVGDIVKGIVWLIGLPLVVWFAWMAIQAGWVLFGLE